MHKKVDADQGGKISELQLKLSEAEQRLNEGELIRRKLHNTIQVKIRCLHFYPCALCAYKMLLMLISMCHRTCWAYKVPRCQDFYLLHDCWIGKYYVFMYIQELKGNVRVFCRVRPLLVEDEDSEQSQSVVQYPQFGDLVGRGIELIQADGIWISDQLFSPLSVSMLIKV